MTPCAICVLLRGDDSLKYTTYCSLCGKRVCAACKWAVGQRARAASIHYWQMVRRLFGMSEAA